MDHDSQELRAHSPSWPPGFFVGSAVPDTSETRSRHRYGLTLICLAVCAYCFGFAATDWLCQSSDKAVAAARAQADAIAPPRERSVEQPGERAIMPIAQAGAVAASPPVPERARRLASSSSSLPIQKRSKPARAAVSAQTQQVAPEASDEPSPAVSLEEVNQALALAAASQRIFASVDEVAAKPVLAVPPTAAAVRSNEGVRKANVVEIEGLSVEGGLPSRVVNRGVQRLLPQYDRCRQLSDSAPQRLQLSTTIDEAGRARRITVEGLSHPDLRRCLEQATAHLVVPAPDTGTARARWVVRFAAR